MAPLNCLKRTVIIFHVKDTYKPKWLQYYNICRCMFKTLILITVSFKYIRSFIYAKSRQVFKLIQPFIEKVFKEISTLKQNKSKENPTLTYAWRCQKVSEINNRVKATPQKPVYLHEKATRLSRSFYFYS